MGGPSIWEVALHVWIIFVSNLAGDFCMEILKGIIEVQDTFSDSSEE